MLSSFELNMPSIPSHCMKFKIQDIKPRAFGTQRNRFSQNKSLLTQKFINSFSNFFAKQPISPTKQVDSPLQFISPPTKTTFRMVIPQQKKHLSIIKPPRTVSLRTTVRGYTFYKAKPPVSLNKDTSPQPTQESIPQSQAMKPKAKPTSAFANETRAKVYNRLERLNNVPGPGSYNPLKTTKSKKNNAKRNHREETKLKDIITSIVQSGEDVMREQTTKPIIRPNHMFVADDRDRFGAQVYPIANKSNVPGPGAYDLGGTIQEKVNRVVLVEEQRKLLMQWFKA